jgi:hypothetical protein
MYCLALDSYQLRTSEQQTRSIYHRFTILAICCYLVLLHFIEMYCEMLCIVVISCMIGASFVGGMLDIVWEHGENVGTGFKCKYYRETKNGGCCTRLKEHLANSGKIVKKCISVHPDIKTYFQRDLDKTKNKKREMFRQ